MSNILIPELKALVDADQLPVFALVRNLRFVPDPFALHTLVERVAAWIWDQMNVIDPGLRQTVRAWRNQQGEIQVDFPGWADNLWFDGLVVATTEPVPVPPQTPETDGWIPRAPTIPALVRTRVLQWARERMFGG